MYALGPEAWVVGGSTTPWYVIDMAVLHRIPARLLTGVVCRPPPLDGNADVLCTAAMPQTTGHEVPTDTPTMSVHVAGRVSLLVIHTAVTPQLGSD